MKLRFSGTLLAVLACSVLPLAGQSPPPDPNAAQAASELAGIREALDRLVRLQEAQRQQKQVEVVLKRIDVWTHRLAPLELKLAGAEEKIRSEEDGLRTLDRMEEQHENRLQEEIRDGVDVPRSETRRMLEDIVRSKLSREEKIDEARQRVARIESELGHGYDQIAILDEMLLELLEDER